MLSYLPTPSACRQYQPISRHISASRDQSVVCLPSYRSKNEKNMYNLSTLCCPLSNIPPQLTAIPFGFLKDIVLFTGRRCNKISNYILDLHILVLLVYLVLYLSIRTVGFLYLKRPWEQLSLLNIQKYLSIHGLITSKTEQISDEV